MFYFLNTIKVKWVTILNILNSHTQKSSE